MTNTASKMANSSSKNDKFSIIMLIRVVDNDKYSYTIRSIRGVRDQTNRGYKKTNRNRNIYDPYSFSFNRNRIFQNGIPIRFNRIRIFDFNVPFKRKRIQYFTRIIRLNRISNYLTEFGPNNSVQPNIRSFSQIKRN